MIIPIIIISYNNWRYVDNTIKQIVAINPNYETSLIIMDNCSTDAETIEYLQNTNVKVRYNKTNNGPWVTDSCNSEVYNEMPNEFILTDPDLQFNTHLPNNFIEVLSELSKQYKCKKIGFALDISDYDEMYQCIYFFGQSILGWESQFWDPRISNENYELYEASIDTTFCLINKEFNNRDIRIAGTFIAKHLPWYISNTIYNKYEQYCLYLYSEHSTIKTLFLANLNEEYSKIQKRNEVFFIRNDLDNLRFWCNHYKTWENEKFDVFDSFLQKDKIFIDIGGWIGTTAMYASRKSKQVYVVEADSKSFADLKKNCSTNCRNFTLIHKAIFNEDTTQMIFGKNKFLADATLNDSTSQLHTEPPNVVSSEYHYIETITLRTLLKEVNPYDISLIKVDIEGGEEHILQDIYEYHTKYNIKAYVSFHYSWWTDKNLDRFSFLTTQQKQSIYKEPFISILF